MKLASEFSVPAPPDRVFPLFFDPETMRACIPGCAELARLDQNTYRGTLVNEIAHVRFAANFSATVQSVTEPSEVTAVLKGEDRKLGSTIKIDATLTVREDNGSSIVGYVFDLALWGRLGRLGEPIIRRRSREVELQFVEALTAVCGGAPHQDRADETAQPAAGTGAAPQSLSSGAAPRSLSSGRRRVIAAGAVAVATVLTVLTRLARGRR